MKIQPLNNLIFRMPKNCPNKREKIWSVDLNYPSSDESRGFSDSPIEGWAEKVRPDIAERGWKMSRQFGRKGDPRYMQIRYLTRIGFRLAKRRPKKQVFADETGYQADLENNKQQGIGVKKSKKQQEEQHNLQKQNRRKKKKYRKKLGIKAKKYFQY
jgi:hypothetical protein